MKPSSLDEPPGRGSERPVTPAQQSTSAERAPAFEGVYEQYFEFVWRSLRLLGVGRESLDDAVQDTFGVIVRQLPHFEGRSSLRTWVYGIAQRVAANHRRGYRRKSAALEPLDHHALPSREPDAHSRAEAREAAELIVRFCSTLEPDRRTLFVLGTSLRPSSFSSTTYSGFDVFEVGRNPMLTRIDGAGLIPSSGSVVIYENASLTEINLWPIQSLTLLYVVENAALSSIQMLQPALIVSLVMKDNPQLSTVALAEAQAVNRQLSGNLDGP